ncbi:MULTISPECIES: hypothetical protein [unclassified Enterococcus]|uniref:hypothetical protein n=1 Tax=unclassified Enterococcus TaxID=2608891 RepID=UPI0015521027|nr:MULTISPECIES: hypothetical protein [unclassified Enterococcus]MBS7576780.1 hypothetical protein [Enterococcus sp. MMGLQ5-2]MBS7583733.1 hypothetical protein [Enterococcus sp. MMGLQ5-1]NPD11594.1 hypothetical protein [Enterococcus sp. MMGLQ5-1]NPD36617.1 hypothetical protein [Enterococcus sp. MMGLQ5-2]
MNEILELGKLIAEKLPKLKTSSDYWLVRTDSGSYYEDFNSGSFIGLGWNGINDNVLSKIGTNVDELKKKIEDLYKEDKQPGRTANQILSFIHDIKIGDMVVIPSLNSEFYMMGEVISDLYFEDSILQDPNSCPFTKRKKVKWIKSFQKKDADPKILKLSYRQQTVNNINEYKTFINRALYSAYIDDDELVHLTYDINIEENINMIDLGNFIYNYSQIYELLSGDKDVDIKINAQSKGKSEIVSKTFAGIGVATVIFGLCQMPYGGEISLGGGILPEISVKTEGIIPQKEKIKVEKEELKIKKEEKKRENLTKDIENAEKIIDLSEKLGVSVENLNIELPKEVREILKQKQEKSTTSPEDNN